MNPECKPEIRYSDRKSHYLQNWIVFENGLYITNVVIGISKRLGFKEPIKYGKYIIITRIISC